MNLACVIILQEECNNPIMALLKGNCQWGKAVFCGQSLIGSMGQQIADNNFMVLLG
jgi:hypothetical protein